MIDPVLILSVAILAVICAWVLQRVLTSPIEVSQEPVMPPSLEETRHPTQPPPENKAVVEPLSSATLFEMRELPLRIVHRQALRELPPTPLLDQNNKPVSEVPHYKETVISPDEMVIHVSDFDRHAHEGRHLFFDADTRVLLEVWEIAPLLPAYPWLESLRASTLRLDELFTRAHKKHHDSLPAALEIVEAYLLTPLSQFKDLTRSRIEEHLATCNLESTSREIFEGGGDFGLLGKHLGEHLLFWVVRGHWHEPLRVGILRQRRQEWVAAGLWSHVLHLLGRLVVLAPEARKLHGKAAGTWVQLRGALRELVNAHIEQKKGTFPCEDSLLTSELEGILKSRDRWPAWNLKAGKRNIWKVVRPLAEMEPSTTRLGHILAQMRQESWEQHQLCLDTKEDIQKG